MPGKYSSEVETSLSLRHLQRSSCSSKRDATTVSGAGLVVRNASSVALQPREGRPDRLGDGERVVLDLERHAVRFGADSGGRSRGMPGRGAERRSPYGIRDSGSVSLSTGGGQNGEMPDGADYWEQQAMSFDDAADHGLRDPAVRGAWRSLLMPLLPPAPARVADLGCGTGSLAVLIAEAGYAVSGIDLAAGMIERARAKAAAAAVAVDFEVGDASRPPWADELFDVVLCRHVLWALEDHAAAVREWVRILRPTGRLVLIEGRWWTGAGLPATTVLDLLTAVDRSATMLRLDDPALWGTEITDERYLVLSPASPTVRTRSRRLLGD